jgi:cephalosporin hydroxylase
MATVNTTAWHKTSGAWPTYRGVSCQQLWADMDRYAELIHQLEPPFIVEVGRAQGGTALYLADRLEKTGSAGPVISIDVEPVRNGLTHPRLDCLTCSSTASEAMDRLLQARTDAGGRNGLVLLDGNHAANHVALELTVYPHFADYLIVEDTIMRDLGTGYAENGPHLALDPWLPAHPEWRPDPDPIPTQHPGGYLRRRIHHHG